MLAPVPFLGALAALSGWWALRRLRGSYATGHAQAWLGVIVGSALIRAVDSGGVPALRELARELREGCA